MPITAVSLSNQALQKVGTRTTITSLDPLVDDSNEAEQCALAFENTRRTALAAAWWNFARKTDILELNKAAPGTPENTDPVTDPIWRPSNNWPPPPWLYEYKYPADCVTARYVNAQGNVSSGIPIFGNMGNANYQAGGPVRFTIQSGTDVLDSASAITTVCTNARDALLVYTRDHQDYNLWPPNFESAMFWGMSGNLAIALSGDKVLAKMLFGKANEVLVQARLSDGNEGFTIIDHVPDWIQARGFGEMQIGHDNIPQYGSLFGVD